jgi:hypothetical protein
LSTLPRDEWITNGGTIANQRASYTDQQLRDLAAHVAERLAAGRD